MIHKYYFYCKTAGYCRPGYTKRLQRVAKKISRYAFRVQKSIFEIAADETTVNALQKKLEKVIKEEDYIAIIPLCEQDWQKAEKYGTIVQDNSVKGKYELL